MSVSGCHCGNDLVGMQLPPTTIVVSTFLWVLSANVGLFGSTRPHHGDTDLFRNIRERLTLMPDVFLSSLIDGFYHWIKEIIYHRVTSIENWTDGRFRIHDRNLLFAERARQLFGRDLRVRRCWCLQAHAVSILRRKCSGKASGLLDLCLAPVTLRHFAV